MCIVNLFKENQGQNRSLNFKLGEEKLVEQMIIFTKEKQKEFKIRLANMKNKNIFEFLESRKGNENVNNNLLNSSSHLLLNSRENNLRVSFNNINHNDSEIILNKSQALYNKNKLSTVQSRNNEMEDEDSDNKRPQTNLQLSNEIMNKIDDNNKNLIFVITDFIGNEKISIEAIFNEIENDKVTKYLILENISKYKISSE
jgi:hypothetical protein